MNSDTKQKSRSVYVAPRLTTFGAVGRLTQSGSTGVPETNPGGMGQMNMQIPMN